MTIANVTAATAITAAWGNSVADAINDDITPGVTNANAAVSRLDRGVYAFGSSIGVSDSPSAFATGTAFRITGTETTLTRPAWSSGDLIVQVTSAITYSTDANVAELLTHLAYKVDSGSWSYVSEDYAGYLSMAASANGRASMTHTLVFNPTTTVIIAAAGRQSSGAGSVTIGACTLNGVAWWEATS